MKKEYCLIQNSAAETQKLIRTWMSTGYEIEILSQIPAITHNGIITIILTSLYRIKEN